MFKYLMIVNLLVIVVVTQDMPPPDLELPTKAPSITTETTTSTTEAVIITTETATETTTEPTTTTATTTTTEVSPATTTESTTIEAVATNTEPITEKTSPTSTTQKDVPVLPTTDSPFLTTTTTTTTNSAPTYPIYPSFPNYLSPKCYFKQQYGFPQLRWSCHDGLKYVYPIECFQCCYFEFSNFAGCYRVQSHYCKSVSNQGGFYK